MATPLPTGTPSAPAPPQLGATPYQFMAGSVTQKHLPNEARDRLEAWSYSMLVARAKDALVGLGYTLSAFDPIELPTTVKVAKHPRTLYGTMVGERDLRLDLALRKAAGQRAVVLFLIAVGLGAIGIFAVLSYGRPYAALSLMGAAIVGVAGVISFSGRGAFDSDLIYLVFETTPNAPEGTTLTSETPFTFDIWAGSARVSSANWTAKHSNGRDFRAILASASPPSATPHDLFQRIRG
ncbi:MAG: hypothetical protein L3K18_03885 [Thermoplasmata archaeon]|nr:hypothetical protein [Thermoplasmata archaeon]